MPGCFQNFSLFDFPTPTHQINNEYPDEMLSLLQEVIPTQQQTQPNLDIIFSKFLNNELNDIEIQQLPQEHRLLMGNVHERSQACRKRPDQYQKLFFKRAFKYAEKQFFGQRKNKSRKMSCFYHHYFEQTAKQMNIPLVNFYHPDRKTKPGLRVGQKSFNKSYIKLLLRSDSFREISKQYRLKFMDESIKERTQKIPKFVTYLKGVMLKHGNDYKKVSEAIRSSKCKVPWTNQQIQEADRRAQSQLQDHLRYSKQSGDQFQQKMESEDIQSQDNLSSSS